MRYLKHKRVIKHRWRDVDGQYYIGEVERDFIEPLMDKNYRPKEGEEILDEKEAVKKMWFSTGEYENAPTRVPTKFYRTFCLLGELDEQWKNPEPPAFEVPPQCQSFLQLEIPF